jgi:aspartyl protease family protein
MSTMNRHLRTASIFLGLIVSTGAAALDVNVVGLFPNKAVLQIEGGALQTLSVGQKTRDDVTLLSVERDGATLNVQGRRIALALGIARGRASPAAADYPNADNYSNAANYAKVPRDESGNLVAEGQVDGMPMQFVVDTGATLITLPSHEANRLGLDYHKGQQTVVQTANGNVLGYRLKLDTVRVGGIAEHSVDAVVLEGNGLSKALLGMSFLNRVDIKREGTNLTLTKQN